jgi:hypothetical protein
LYPSARPCAAADPGETRGWAGVGGAGFGGAGAGCPPAGQALPAAAERGGAGYGYADFIAAATAGGDPYKLPPYSGTSAGGLGGGRVVVVTETLRLRGGGVVSASGGAADSEEGSASAPGGGSGGSVIIYAKEVDTTSRTRTMDNHGTGDEEGEEYEDGGGDAGEVVAAGGDGVIGTNNVDGGGGGGGRVTLLSPEVWPPSILVSAGGGRSAGECGALGYNGAAGTVLNTASGALIVSNLGRGGAGASPTPSPCLDPTAWGTCAVTHLVGPLPLRGVASLLITSAAVVCTDACPSAQSGSRRERRHLLGGGGGGGGGNSVVHLEVSSAITLTGSAHLLHGDASSPSRGGGGLGVDSLYGQTVGGGSGDRAAAAATLWLVAPAVSVADWSTLQVVGSVVGLYTLHPVDQQLERRLVSTLDPMK